MKTARTNPLATTRRDAVRDALFLLSPCLCPSAPSSAQDVVRAARDLLEPSTELHTKPAVRDGSLAHWQLSSVATMARQACRSIRGTEDFGDQTRQREPICQPNSGQAFCVTPSVWTSTLRHISLQEQASHPRMHGPRTLPAAVLRLSQLLFVALLVLVATSFGSLAHMRAFLPSADRPAAIGSESTRTASQLLHGMEPERARESHEGPGRKLQVAEKADRGPPQEGQRGPWSLENVTAPHLRWFGAMQGCVSVGLFLKLPDAQ